MFVRRKSPEVIKFRVGSLELFFSVSHWSYTFGHIVRKTNKQTNKPEYLQEPNCFLQTCADLNNLLVVAETRLFTIVDMFYVGPLGITM